MFKRLVAGTIVGGLLSVAALAVPAAVAPSAGATACPSDAWSADADGRPSEVGAGLDGAALWRIGDTDVFRFRVSEPGRDLELFRGTISTDGVLVVRGRHLERGDISLRRSPHRVDFALANFGGVDGFDIALECASYVKLNVRGNGNVPLATDDIVIGSGSVHPDANPFRIERVAAAVS